MNKYDIRYKCIFFLKQILFAVIIYACLGFGIEQIDIIKNTSLYFINGNLYNFSNMIICFLILFIITLINVAPKTKIFIKKFQNIFFLLNVLFFIFIYVNKTLNYIFILNMVMISILFATIQICTLTGVVYDKKLKYSSNYKNNIYSDDPIDNYESLAKHLKNEVLKVENILDTLPKSTSFVLSLEGDWGSGKTSILLSLEKKLNERNNTKNNYFIIKINTLLFKDKEEILQYINKYISHLFYKYNVTFFDGNYTKNYLDSVLKNLSKTTVGISDFIHNLGVDFYSIEYQKNIFENDVNCLLKKSNRKFILLLIDDIDRIEDEESILKILKEVLGIKGIVCCLLRKPRNFENNLDKFINTHINIGKNNRDIEKDEEINKLLNLSLEEYFDNIVYNDKRYIELNNNYKPSCVITGYPITQLLNHDIVEQLDIANMFYDIFLLDCAYHKCDIGTKLEEIIMKFYINTTELRQFNKINSTSEYSEYLLEQLNFKHMCIWDNSISFRQDSWMNNLGIFIHQFICDLPDLIDTLKQANERRKFDCNTLVDLYTYIHARHNMQYYKGLDAEEYERQKERFNLHFIYIYEIMFTFEEKAQINHMLSSPDYPKLIELLKRKYIEGFRINVRYFFLEYFLNEFREILNNPRKFKMMLRNANLNNSNIIEDVLKEINIDGKAENYINKKIKGLKREDLISNQSYSMEDLKGLLINAIYLHYIDSKNDINDINDNRRQLLFLNRNLNQFFIKKVIINDTNEKVILTDKDYTISGNIHNHNANENIIKNIVSFQYSGKEFEYKES